MYTYRQCDRTRLQTVSRYCNTYYLFYGGQTRHAVEPSRCGMFELYLRFLAPTVPFCTPLPVRFQNWYLLGIYLQRFVICGRFACNIDHRRFGSEHIELTPTTEGGEKGTSLATLDSSAPQQLSKPTEHPPDSAKAHQTPYKPTEIRPTPAKIH